MAEPPKVKRAFYIEQEYADEITELVKIEDRSESDVIRRLVIAQLTLNPTTQED